MEMEILTTILNPKLYVLNFSHYRKYERTKQPRYTLENRVI